MGINCLPDVPKTISARIVMGDSRRPETRNLIWCRHFTFGADTCSSVRPEDKIDIVPANYVDKAIVTIHQKEAPAARIYHLSLARVSQTYHELTDSIRTTADDAAYVLALTRRAFFEHGEWVANRSGAGGLRSFVTQSFSGRISTGIPFSTILVWCRDGEAPANSRLMQPAPEYCRENKFHFPAKPWPAAAAPGKMPRQGEAGLTDFLLVAWVSALIEITRFGWMLGLGKRWTPGEKT